MIEVRITENEVWSRARADHYCKFVEMHFPGHAWSSAVRALLREKGIRLRPTFSTEFNFSEVAAPSYFEHIQWERVWIVRQWEPGEEGAPQ